MRPNNPLQKEVDLVLTVQPTPLNRELAIPTPNLGNFQQLPPQMQASIGFLSRLANENTRRQYQQMLEVYLEWCAAVEIDPMTAVEAQVQMFIVWLRDPRQNDSRGFSQSTVAGYWTVVKGFYKFALRSKLVQEDPTAWISTPEVDPERQRRTFLRPLEFAQFMKTAESLEPREYATLALLGARGLRVEEACGLDVTSMDNLKGQRTISYIGKGNKFHRQKLPVEVAWAIDQSLNGREMGPLLVNAWGNRMDRLAATRLVKKCAIKAGVNSDISPHSMRRSFATFALTTKAVSLIELQQIMGHSDPKTTMIYHRLADALDGDVSQAVVSQLMMVIAA